MGNSADIFKKSFDQSAKDITKIEPEVMLGIDKMKNDMT